MFFGYVKKESDKNTTNCTLKCPKLLARGWGELPNKEGGNIAKKCEVDKVDKKYS